MREPVGFCGHHVGNPRIKIVTRSMLHEYECVNRLLRQVCQPEASGLGKMKGDLVLVRVPGLPFSVSGVAGGLRNGALSSLLSYRSFEYPLTTIPSSPGGTPRGSPSYLSVCSRGSGRL